MSVNGFQTIGHEQLQAAIQEGIQYTLHVNGAIYFDSNVTARDMDAIAAVYCNGFISAPDSARGALDSKVRDLNGRIIDIDAMIKKLYGDDSAFHNDPIGFIQKIQNELNGGEQGTGINTGTFRL